VNKKTLIIIGGVIAVIIVGFVLFFIFREPTTEETREEGFLSFLFPSSEDKSGGPLPGPSDKPETGDLPGDYSTQGKLTRLTSMAVSGAVFNEESLKVQYFEKATGHMYEIDAFGKKEKKRTITTIPKIFEVFWSKNADKAILRYLAEPEEANIVEPVHSFVATSLASTTEGIFLPLNTLAAVTSPEEEKIFYLLEADTTAGIIASFENKNQKEIFYSPFGEFLISWPTKNTITLLTKPTALIEGYLYRLNAQTGSFTKILGDIKGLTALYSPHGNKILYSESERTIFETKIYDINEGTSSNFNYKTLPEKCIFSPINENIIFCAVPNDLPPARYPDDWYKGLISFSDTLWQIDLANGSTEIILEGGEFDIINLFSNSTGAFIFFQNKKDGTLWSLKLTD
jgi:hypothetical protein